MCYLSFKGSIRCRGTIMLFFIGIILIGPIVSVKAAPSGNKIRRDASHSSVKTLQVSKESQVDKDDGEVWYPTIDTDEDYSVDKDHSDHQKPHKTENLEKKDVTLDYDSDVSDDESESHSSDESSVSSASSNEQTEDLIGENENNSDGDWIQAIKILFKKFGFREDEIPEPFGSKKSQSINIPSPEFGMILQGLISKTPASLNGQLKEIMEAGGVKDLDSKSHDKMTMLKKIDKTVKEIQGGLQHGNNVHGNSDSSKSSNFDPSYDGEVGEEKDNENSMMESSVSFKHDKITLHKDLEEIKTIIKDIGSGNGKDNEEAIEKLSDLVSEVEEIAEKDVALLQSLPCVKEKYSHSVSEEKSSSGDKSVFSQTSEVVEESGNDESEETKEATPQVKTQEHSPETKNHVDSEMDKEASKILTELKAIAERERIRHDRHETGQRDAKETSQITQVLKDIQHLGEREKERKMGQEISLNSQEKMTSSMENQRPSNSFNSRKDYSKNLDKSQESYQSSKKLNKSQERYQSSKNVDKSQERYQSSKNVDKSQERYQSSKNLDKPQERYQSSKNLDKSHEKYHSSKNDKSQERYRPSHPDKSHEKQSSNFEKRQRERSSSTRGHSKNSKISSETHFSKSSEKSPKSNEVLKEVSEIIEKEVEEVNKINDEHKKHKEEMLDVIRSLKFSDTSQDDQKRIKKIEDIIEQIDQEHYKELELESKLENLAHGHETVDDDDDKDESMKNLAHSHDTEEDENEKDKSIEKASHHVKLEKDSSENHDLNSLKEKINENDEKIIKYVEPNILKKFHASKKERSESKSIQDLSSEENLENGAEYTEKFHHVKKTRVGNKHHEKSQPDLKENQFADIRQDSLKPFVENTSTKTNNDVRTNDQHEDTSMYNQEQIPNSEENLYKTEEQQPNNNEGNSYNNQEQQFNNQETQYSNQDDYDNKISIVENIREVITEKPLPKASVSFKHTITKTIPGQSSNVNYKSQITKQSSESDAAQYSNNYNNVNSNDYVSANDYSSEQQQTQTQNQQATKSGYQEESYSSNSKAEDNKSESQSVGSNSGMIFKTDTFHTEEGHQNTNENSIGNSDSYSGNSESYSGNSESYSGNSESYSGNSESYSGDSDMRPELEDVESGIVNLQNVLQNINDIENSEHKVEDILNNGPKFTQNTSPNQRSPQDFSPEYLDNVIEDERQPNGHSQPQQHHHVQEHGDAVVNYRRFKRHPRKSTNFRPKKVTTK